MLKHSDLTRRRIEQFLKYELEPKVVTAEEPLRVFYCGEPYRNQEEAAQGAYVEVDPGFRFGPAYATVWFKIAGTVPNGFEGKEIGLMAEVGGERTIWIDGKPWIGVDVEHEVVPLWAHGLQGVVATPLKPGQKVEFHIQSYTRNPQVSVHREGPPREDLVETVKFAKLVAVDIEWKALAYDYAFALDLLSAWEESSPHFHTLLRALNDVCNLHASEGRTALAAMRKRIRDAITSTDWETAHSVFPLGHAHLDTAWLWPLEITRKKMAHTTANQLRLMERYPEYVYVHSQASQYEWLEKEYPALFQEVREAVQRGQWEPVGSMWVEADCNLTGGESLVRQFLYGRKYFRERLGMETHDMFLPDVFGYSAALPQILDQFHIKYFLTQKISWNQVNKFPHNTFWWQGIDGTRVWSHFPPADTYIGDCTPKQILESVRKHKDHARSDQSLYLFGWGDGGGGPTERHIEFLRRAKVASGLPEIQFGKRAIDFYREARSKSRDLPVWAGELYLEIHRGTFTSQANNKLNNRECEFLMRDAEWLACFAPEIPYPASELESAWKLVLLNQFHDIIPGSSVREVYEDSDRDYAKVRNIGENIVFQSLREIANRFDTSGMARPCALFHNSTVVSQASLQWPQGAAPQSLVTEDDVYPVQLVEEFGERKIIFQTPHAALGAVCVGDLTDQQTPSRHRLKASNRRLENAELSIRFDANGNITSIQSLEDGSEFIKPGSLANVFQLLDDKPLFWSAWDVDVYAFETAQDLLKSESFEVVERGPVRVAVEVVRKFSKSTIRQRISLGPTPGIRFDTEVDWHEEDKFLKVAFPLNLNVSSAACEIQFGHVERATHKNTSWDLARFEVPAQKWVDLSEADHGVALINVGKYGHDFDGSVVRLSLLRSPKAPDPLCDMGTHRFTYVLLPHFGGLNHGGVVHASYAVNSPVRVLPLEPTGGYRGSIPPFISCDDRNLVIETIKRAEDGEGMIVRLYECHNARGRAELYCAHPPSSASLCDLEENEIEELEIIDGAVAFRYEPFKILTFRLRF